MLSHTSQTVEACVPADRHQDHQLILGSYLTGKISSVSYVVNMNMQIYADKKKNSYNFIDNYKSQNYSLYVVFL